MNKNDIFESSNYRTYLKERLELRGKRSGFKAELAHHMGVQTAYLSQVLHEKTHLSAEQAILVTTFFSLSALETEYFLALIHFERAGNPELKSHYQKKLKTLKEEHLEKSKLLTIHRKSSALLTRDDQIRYYSSWVYAAVHVATSIPTLATIEALVMALRVPRTEIESVVEFLKEVGLVVEKKDKLAIGPTMIHLPDESYFISKQHTNWRLQTLRAIEANQSKNLHYSGVFSMSQQDFEKLKKRIRVVIEENLKDILQSPEEILVCSTFDFFQL